MGKPAARLTDMHTCPMVTPGLPPIPHVGGPITGPGCPSVLIGGLPAAVMGDMCVCVGPPDTIVLGSSGVMIGGKPAARMGDQCGHGGAIVVGCPTVLIGEIASSPVGGLGVMPISALLSVMSNSAPAIGKKLAQIITLKQAAMNGVPFCEKCVASVKENKEIIPKKAALINDFDKAWLDQKWFGGKVSSKVGYVSVTKDKVEVGAADFNGVILNNPFSKWSSNINFASALIEKETMINHNGIKLGFSAGAALLSGKIKTSALKMPIPFTKWDMAVDLSLGGQILDISGDVGIHGLYNETDKRYHGGGHLGGGLGVGLDFSLDISFGKQ